MLTHRTLSMKPPELWETVYICYLRLLREKLNKLRHIYRASKLYVPLSLFSGSVCSAAPSQALWSPIQIHQQKEREIMGTYQLRPSILISSNQLPHLVEMHVCQSFT